jgi:hypothetical protein
MLDCDDHMDGLTGFRELDEDDALLDEEDREAEAAIAAWLSSREAYADSGPITAEQAAAVTIRFGESIAVDGDLYMDCLTMFLLTRLDFELEARDAAASSEQEQILPDDRWQLGGEGMVPDDFRQRLERARWKAERQWGAGFFPTCGGDQDYETQSRDLFEALAERGLCRINQAGSYENPFLGMTPMDFGDFPDDFDDDCAM